MSRTAGSLQNNLTKFSVAWLTDTIDYFNSDSTWYNAINHTRERVGYNPTDGNTAPVMGNTVSFKLLNKGPKCFGRPVLNITRSAIGAATLASLPTPGALSMIKEYRLIYGQRVFWRFNTQQLYDWWLKYNSSEYRSVMGQEIGANIKNLDMAIRDGAFARTYRIELPVPWEDKDWPLHIESLADGIDIEIDLQPLAKCIRYTGTTVPTMTLSNVSLYQSFIFVPRTDQDALFWQGYKGEGWEKKVLTYQFQKAVQTQAAGIQNIQLRNIGGDVANISVWATKQRQSANMVAATAATADIYQDLVALSGGFDNARYSPFRYYKPYLIDLTDGQNNVKDTAELYLKFHQRFVEAYMLNGLLEPSDVNLPFQGDYSKSFMPSLRNNWGFLNLTPYADPTLQLTWTNTGATISASVAPFWASTKFRGHSMSTTYSTADADATSYASGDYAVCHTAGPVATLDVTVAACVHNTIKHINGDITVLYKV